LGNYRIADSSDLVIPSADPILERTYTDLLSRLYVAPGLPPIMLLIALGDGGDAGLAVHRPEECYPAIGFALSDRQRTAIGGIPGAGDAATIVRAGRGEWEEQVYFWVRIGSRFPVSGWDQRMATMRYDLSGRRADGALVRLSRVGADREQAVKQMQEFNATMLAALPPRGRRLIEGAGAA
jgi:EpsI family protein